LQVARLVFESAEMFHDEHRENSTLEGEPPEIERDTGKPEQ
jgi:hypothetical protein